MCTFIYKLTPPDFGTQKIRILQLIDKQYFVSLRYLIWVTQRLF